MTTNNTTAPTPDTPRPATDYDLDRYLPGVMSNGAFDSAGCRWCHRPTLNMFTGHDGYCPIPALFAIHARLRAAEADRDQWKRTAERIDQRVESALVTAEADRDEASAMAARMAEALETIGAAALEFGQEMVRMGVPGLESALEKLESNLQKASTAPDAAALGRAWRAMLAVIEPARIASTQIICLGGDEQCQPCQNRDKLCEALAEAEAALKEAGLR